MIFWITRKRKGLGTKTGEMKTWLVVLQEKGTGAHAAIAQRIRETGREVGLNNEDPACAMFQGKGVGVSLGKMEKDGSSNRETGKPARETKKEKPSSRDVTHQARIGS